jgi:hypothetical protein
MKWLALFLALIASPCWAQPSQMPLLGVGSAATSTYTGPGDIVSGATAWYGLRAYNAAYATGSNNAINVRRASDNSTENIVILATGALDIATANSFAGTDATCTGTISTTTLSCTSASSTPHVGSTITGTGVTQPCYITAVGTFTSGSGTATIAGAGGTSPCGTVSSGETITMQYGLYITEWFDQSGSGSCSGACNQSESTAGDQPQLMPICFNSLPCMLFNGSAKTLTTSQDDTKTTGIVTFSGIVEKIPASGNGNWDLQSSGSATNRVFIPSTANTLGLNNTISVTTATDGVPHIFQMVSNTTSSVVNIDGSETTGTITLDSTSGLINMTTGSTEIIMAGEWGIWDAIVFTSTQRRNVCHNERLYWGVGGGSC